MITIPIEILSIDNDGFHLFVKAKMSGKAVRLLIDTGASKTVFDRKRINRFVKKGKLEKVDKLSTGLGTNSMKSHLISLPQLKIGGLVIKNYKTVLLDLSHVNASYASLGLQPLDGVIGSDLLVLFKAVIDYAKKELKVKSVK